MNNYEKWIKTNVALDPYLKCAEITKEMNEAFPELDRVRGHYMDTTWGERAHWWLKDLDGNIVDPTAGQFPSKGLGEYVEWDESKSEPTGKCPNCGEYCYDHNYLCSKECEVSYEAYVRTGS